MSRVLLAWELGGNFAHLSRLLPLALELRRRGHKVELAVRELPRAEQVIAPHGFRALPAPLWLGRTPPLAAVPSYAGVIRRCGYHDHDSLSPLVAAWLRLFDLLAPDLVIAEHAPTAVLAARCRGLPFVRFGTGWSVPPAAPASVTPWTAVDPRLLRRAEAQVVAAINRVLREHGAAPLRSLAALFAGSTDLLATFPELDHFGARTGVSYRGPVEGSVAAAAPDWPDGQGERVFAFLESGYPHLEAFAKGLAGLGLPAILYARDLTPSRARTLAGPRLRIVTEPVDFEAASRTARLIVCHGDHGTVSGALRAGVPLLVLARHADQELLGYRIAKQKLGITLRRGAARPDFAATVRRLLDDATFAVAAQRFAARHAGHDIDAAIAGMADACEAALTGLARPASAGVSAGGA